LLDTHNAAFNSIIKNFDRLDEKSRLHAENVFKEAMAHINTLADKHAQQLQTQSQGIENIISSAKAEFQRAVSKLTTENNDVLMKQIAQLDQELQAELKKAIEKMGSHLAALSGKFVQDYTPLTDKLRDVVKLAEHIKSNRN
jgi:F0F1-type ATP synthase membrane subunit b/b'